MTAEQAAFAAIRAIEDRYESGVFPKRPLAIVRGQGARLWTAEGKAYIDAGASYGCMNVGHGNPDVTAAILRQVERLTYVSQTIYNDERAQLLQTLAGLVPGLTRGYLCNSGTEAVETALKFARGHTRRAGIVAAENAFHGRTLGALSATWKPEYRDPFLPLVPGFSFVPFGDEEALKAAITRETAAVILEPVQGEGGVHVPPPRYLRAAGEIARDAGALLILDEIQTGLGRTGRLFALERSRAEPDIVCLGKSLAGGLPAGAALLRPEVCTLPKAAHGNTFGGGPLVSAAANAAIGFLQRERLPERAARLGEQGLKRLSALSVPSLKEVRGLGLMIGIEVREKATSYLNRLLENGIIPLPSGPNTIRLLPPLVISEPDWETVLDAVEGALLDRA